MSNIDAIQGTGVPQWTSKEEKRGIDPLGMQTTSVALYQGLIPGISNVTLRMRYYGFYAWLAQSYARAVGETSIEVWCRYLRRAEALYALTAAHANSEQGVAGILWANRKLERVDKGSIDFHPNTDRGDEPQYLKQKFGAFGAAYGSQLVEIGVLEYVDEHPVPVPTEDIGEKLSQAFEQAIGEAAALFLEAAGRGTVTRSELTKMVGMLPSNIGRSGAERQLYEDLLFARLHPRWESARARSLSLRLILEVARANEYSVEAEHVRWALYSQRDLNGDLLDSFGEVPDEQRFAWAVYQANDLLHVAYEALLKFTLDLLSVPPSGIPLGELVARVSGRITEALSGWNAQSWRDLTSALALSEDPWSDTDEYSEFSLSSALLDSADGAGLGDETFARSAVLLLAVLHKRWEGELERVEARLAQFAHGEYSQWAVSEFRLLQSWADLPLQELLARLVKSRVVERHLWVAIQKFRGQGDYTFLLELDDGRVRLRQRSGPVLTNPRLSTSITFLHDIHLLGDTGPTSAGVRLLEAA